MSVITSTGQRPVAAPGGHPSVFSANVLYLATIVLVLVIGSTMQARHFGWGLFFTEIGLLLLPALLWFRAGHLSLRKIARLHWPGWAPILWSLLLGAGLWLLDTWLSTVMSALLGYNLLAPTGSYPTTAGQAILIFVAFALAAPIGEEILFRGYIQSAYERRGPRTAILLVGLLFALFHLSLLGLPPRLPIAFALGYVVWRSNSLLPGITLHLANNVLGALVLIGLGLHPQMLDTLPVGTTPSAAVGLLLALIALWAFRRSTPPPAQPTLSASSSSHGRLARTWPLLLALFIWLGVAGLEVVMGRAPELLALGQTLELTKAPESPATWQYQLRHVADETVGAGVCQLDPAAETVSLNCTLQNDAFEIRQANSYWSSDQRTVTLTGTWTAEEMALLATETRIEGSTSELTTMAERQDGEIFISVTGSYTGNGTTTVAPPVLLDMLWPWQLSALPFSSGLVREATLVYPSRWDPDLNASVLTVTDAAVVVHGVEPVNTPAGHFMAWRVTVDGNTAWYDVEAPHTLVKYDDGFLIYLLLE